MVRLNGEQILDARSEAHRTGHLGLQYNQGKSIEFRNIKLKPLGLEPIFDGESLQGWRKVTGQTSRCRTNGRSERDGFT